MSLNRESYLINCNLKGSNPFTYNSNTGFEASMIAAGLGIPIREGDEVEGNASDTV